MKIAFMIIIILAQLIPAFGQDQDTLLMEHFNDTNNWEPLLFPKIASHSTYEIIKDNTNTVLKTKSNASASGLIYKNTFNVSEYPKVKWLWKTDKIFTKGNAKSKKGDDYPIRVYIIFEYNPSEAGFGLRMKYKLAKAIYGEYPPHSSLNYIWANREHDKPMILSPYTSRSVMIALQSGPENVGKWMTEEINIIQDYQEAFDEDPPMHASIAIMNDSDNTGENATSYIDYIQIFK